MQITRNCTLSWEMYSTSGWRRFPNRKVHGRGKTYWLIGAWLLWRFRAIIVTVADHTVPASRLPFPARPFQDSKPRRYPKRARVTTSDHSQPPSQPQFRQESDWQVRGFKDKTVCICAHASDCVLSWEANYLLALRILPPPPIYLNMSNSPTRVCFASSYARTPEST